MIKVELTVPDEMAEVIPALSWEGAPGRAGHKVTVVEMPTTPADNPGNGISVVDVMTRMAVLAKTMEVVTRTLPKAAVALDDEGKEAKE